MTYLVAYKPCGCVEEYLNTADASPGDCAIWRRVQESEGCTVRESEERPSFECPHGTLPAQLVAERAALVLWLREEIAGLERQLKDPWFWNQSIVASAQLHLIRKVLARVEGKGSDHA